MSEAAADDAARQLLDLVIAAMRHLHRLRRVESGLSMPQFKLLMTLKRKGELSMSALAERLDLTPPSVSHLVDALASRGLVVREGDAADRRRVVVRLTAGGAAVLAAHFEVVHDHFAELLAELDEAERAALGHLAGRLQAMLRLEPAAECL
ncbi:MAG: MarR family transcriptional regulator [Fimbriimonadaceae bacterium]|nr:MarR family transcriptional regulator [Fimbriimonadaceae bacterium]